MQNLNEKSMQNSNVPNPIQQKSTLDKNNPVLNQENPTAENLDAALDKVRVELINKKKNILIEKIKKTVIEQVYYSEEQLKTNFSDYLSEKLGYHYTYMANLFAKVHGCSIQSFIITTKIERVKELLIYEGLTLTEISYKLHYSSLAHLSNQFKKITGMSPSQYLASISKTEFIQTHKMPESIPASQPTLLQDNPLLFNLGNLNGSAGDAAYQQR